MRLTIKCLLASLVLLLFMGCQDSEIAAELKEFRTRASIEEQNMAVARHYIEILNGGNFNELEQCLASSYAVYCPSGYPDPTSREKLIDNYIAASEAFSEFTWNLEDMIAAGDKVVCRVTVTGVYHETTPEASVPGQEFRFSLITILRLQDGKVVEEWQEDDQLGFARQLGMELKPKNG